MMLWNRADNVVMRVKRADIDINIDKRPDVIRDRHLVTQHPQRKGLYEGDSRN